MNDNLDSVLSRIAEAYASEIMPDSRYYLEVDIGKKGDILGAAGVGKRFKDVNAIVPVKKPSGSMRVRIDGRTFVDYVQFDNGVVVPGYVARETNRPFRAYAPKDSMVLGF